MASWEQKTLAESGIVDNITNTAAAAAETVTDLATQVQDIAEGAKSVIGAFADPIGKHLQTIIILRTTIQFSRVHQKIIIPKIPIIIQRIQKWLCSC